MSAGETKWEEIESRRSLCRDSIVSEQVERPAFPAAKRRKNTARSASRGWQVGLSKPPRGVRMATTQILQGRPRTFTAAITVLFSESASAAAVTYTEYDTSSLAALVAVCSVGETPLADLLPRRMATIPVRTISNTP